MKTHFIFKLTAVAGILFFTKIYADTCQGYFPNKKGSIMETTMYNDKGKKEGTSAITIKDINAKGEKRKSYTELTSIK
jgi:hypothetical protein